MSTSISTSFITDYEADVHLIFQRFGTMLLQAVRWKRDVVGSTAVFQTIAAGTATTKARHGTITPMNQTHSAPSATLADFYAGDWVDALDEAKINIDERMAIARSGAAALGRKIDSQLLTTMTGTSQSTVTWTVTTSNNIRAGLLGMVEAIYSNDVPNDGQLYGILSPKEWAFAMTVEEFASADYVGPNGLPFTEGAQIGRWKDYMGVKWTVHTGVTNAGSANAEPFVWHKNAVGYASGKHPKNFANRGEIVADITWHGDRAAHFINHMMSGGSVLIDDGGVIQGEVDDSADIPTT